jgi:hypothetical protein
MENRRYVTLLLGLLVLVALAPAASAYDNVGMHRAVNTMALAWFQTDVRQYDRTLDNAQLDFIIPVYGYAWDPQDGKDTKKTTYDYSQLYSVYRSKTMGMWIVDGGFSADEPELPMGARHFYDPVCSTRYLNGPGYTGSPKMDAIEWVLGNNGNLYSFYRGKQYFKYALESDNPGRDPFYGCAWRSVGETMHVITDLCCPAHVRNDGHGISEPLEAVTDTYTVLTYAGGKRAKLDYSSITSTHSLQKVLEDVAGWTNGHFFSGDSIGNVKGTYYYPQPQTTRGPDKNGICYMTYDDGQERPAFSRSLTSLFGLTRESFAVEGDALVAQQERIIPTAVRASEAVLDAFLPRFEVKVDSVVEKSGTNIPTYTVTAHITHKPTNEWPSELTIRNGAHILITNDAVGKYVDRPLSVSGGGSLNRFSADVNGDILPGDQVSVYYDFGGYRIFSDPVTVTSLPAATQKPTAAPTARPTAVPTAVPQPTLRAVSDLFTFGNDFTTAYAGYDMSRTVMYTARYAFDDGDGSVYGSIIWDTAGVCGPPQEYSFSVTAERSTNYKSIGTLRATVPAGTAAGTYTGSVTVTDSLGHACTKTYTFTIKP